ncbi:hypothetical protein NQZ79_g1615 [Umbelopsis isabellina]|nr:hypothetical protein NQZ79_g1615 [Umbelopsis isabellina]
MSSPPSAHINKKRKTTINEQKPTDKEVEPEAGEASGTCSTAEPEVKTGRSAKNCVQILKCVAAKDLVFLKVATGLHRLAAPSYRSLDC